MAEPTAVRDAAHACRDTAVDRLRVLVELESPSADIARLDAVAARLADDYATVGGRPNFVDGDRAGHLVVDWPVPDTDRLVLLVAHHDTVHPVGSVADRPFRVDGDTASGPGTVDMKGSHVVVRLAFELMRQLSLSPSTSVRLVSVSDEEVGSPDGRHVIADHLTAATCALALEAPLPGDRLKLGRRGVARVRLSVTGHEAHSGLAAADGVSAIDELVDQLTALRAAAPPPGGDPGLNVGTITGGTTTNVVAGHAAADIGLRFGTPTAEQQVMRAFDGLQPVRDGARVDVQRLTYRPPWPEPARNPLASHVTTTAAALGLELGRGVSGGAGDANQLGAAGLPTVDGLGPDGGGAHAVDEHVSITSLLDRAALLACLLTTPLPAL